MLFRSRSYAILGRGGEAIDLARKSAAAVGRVDPSRQLLPLEDLAVVYLWCEQPAAAVGVLRSLLSMPGVLTAAWLKLDPVYDELRDNIEFNVLMEEFR